MEKEHLYWLGGGALAAAMLVAFTGSDAPALAPELPTANDNPFPYGKYPYKPYKGKFPKKILVIEKYGNLVRASCKNTGLFSSLMMAQMLLESRFGESELTKKYNNFFGIQTSGKWTGAVTPPMKDVAGNVRVFRAYPTVIDSFRDRVTFLQTEPRYAKAGVFNCRTPQEQADKLKAAGYAEAPNYAQDLKNEMATYNLFQLDTP